ncbi:SsrA-binding protein SmpB [Buchnera aphidicola]|uniref:SsrA-binding protein SmpB n=1 Tax=Buchnera aphidicola TaxID=9 RepID=UPI003464299C
MKKNKKKRNNIITNKKAYYNFFIEKTIESGLILRGWEVKSIRLKKINITNSYLSFRNNEIYLIGINIEPFLKSNIYTDYQKNRPIKVLLNKREINFLYGKFKTIGYSLIATSLYWKEAWCKLEIGIAKGKQKKDKRTTIKNREWERKKSKLFKRILT